MTYIFTFEDIKFLDDSAMKVVLDTIQYQWMAPALLNASDEVKKKFFKNLSQQSAKYLKEEMEFIGLVPQEHIEENQNKIFKTVLDLIKDQIINLK